MGKLTKTSLRAARQRNHGHIVSHNNFTLSIFALLMALRQCNMLPLFSPSQAVFFSSSVHCEFPFTVSSVLPFDDPSSFLALSSTPVVCPHDFLFSCLLHRGKKGENNNKKLIDLKQKVHGSGEDQEKGGHMGLRNHWVTEA